MNEAFVRTEHVLGGEAMAKLAAARVAIFGLGGVGGYVLEALARSGVGRLDLIDNDRICLSNLNRQILATRDTVGMDKVDAAAARVKSINPACEVRTYKTFYLPETKGQFDFAQYDYVVMPSTPWRARWSSSPGRRPWACPSSAPWARATSWTPPGLRWRISARPPCARWRG